MAPPSTASAERVELLLSTLAAYEHTECGKARTDQQQRTRLWHSPIDAGLELYEITLNGRVEDVVPEDAIVSTPAHSAASSAPLPTPLFCSRVVTRRVW